ERVWVRPAGEYVVFRDTGRNTQLNIFHARTGEPGGAFSARDPIAEFLPLPDGKMVAWYAGSPTAAVFDPATRTIDRQVPVGNVPAIDGETEFFTSPDMRYVGLGVRKLG